VDAASLLSRYGVYGASAIFCFLGGLFPIFNVETYLVLVASMTETGRDWPAVAAISATSHMGAKLILYAAGLGVGTGVPKRYEAKVEAVKQKLAGWRYGRAGFVFFSAFTGFPPFYAVSVLAGMLRFGWFRFLCAGLPARFLRFAAFLVFPQLCLRLVRHL
jgi:membrane protein YqaA with SNARE-associated domain